MELNKKNSSVSIIKLIGMFMIITSHITPDFGDSSSASYVSSIYATSNIQEFYVIFSKYLGQMGVCFFVVASAYYLVDRCKIRNVKVIEIELDSIFIGLITCIIIFCVGLNVTGSDIIKILLPMSKGTNWFICCYILYYITVPYINKIYINSNKSQIFKLCLFMFIFYSLLQMIFKDNFYSNHLVGFFCIHTFTFYYKNYLTKIQKNNSVNLFIAICSITILLLVVAFLNYIGVRFNIFNNKMQHFRYFMNPFIILSTFSIMSLAINNKCHVKKLDSIAELTLFIYLFHENDIIKNTLRPKFFNWAYELFSYNYLFFICIFASIITYFFSIIFAYVYNITLHKIVELMSKIILKYFDIIIEYIMKRVDYLFKE